MAVAVSHHEDVEASVVAEEAAEAVVATEVAAVEVAHAVASRSSSSHTDMAVFTLPRAKKTFLPPRTWFPATPCTARKRLRYN